MSKNAVYAALLAVQQELKAPKDQYNSFGKYKYRSLEGTLLHARPCCNENGLVLTLSDEVVCMGGRYYVKATAKVTDIATGESIENVAYARESESKKGMDEAQITGACSSYARKYAVCGLFAIDDTKDPDTDEYTARQKSQDSDSKAKTAQPSDNAQAHDDMRKKALSALSKKMKELGVFKEEVAALAGVYYGKLTTTEMTAGEIADLTNNLQKYIQEQTGGAEAVAHDK